MRAQILVVQDDPATAKVLTFLLNDSGYQTSALADGRRVLDSIAERAVDLLVLDDTLPDGDGRVLCTAARRAHPNLPIILLSTRDTLRDKVDGFDRGADDYIVRPFEPAELLARVQAVLRRYRRAERDLYGTMIRVGETALDLSELRFMAPGRPPALLTATEMKVLEYLMRNANAVISREMLVERTWGYEGEGSGNRVEVYIRRLRKKIERNPDEPAYIHTVRGLGYVYREERRTARRISAA